MKIFDRIVADKRIYLQERPLLSLLMAEICIDGSPMSEKQVIAKLVQLRKTSKENFAIYMDKNAIYAARKEEDFINIIDRYLPSAATEDDIRKAINDTGASNIKDMKKLMLHLKSLFDVVDGSLVKQLLLTS